jgi:hypothetical protein
MRDAISSGAPVEWARSSLAALHFTHFPIVWVISARLVDRLPMAPLRCQNRSKGLVR